jgi:hypothetical protein
MTYCTACGYAFTGSSDLCQACEREPAAVEAPVMACHDPMFRSPDARDQPIRIGGSWIYPPKGGW